jgi:hypothetical protein
LKLTSSTLKKGDKHKIHEIRGRQKVLGDQIMHPTTRIRTWRLKSWKPRSRMVLKMGMKEEEKGKLNDNIKETKRGTKLNF